MLAVSQLAVGLCRCNCQMRGGCVESALCGMGIDRSFVIDDVSDVGESGI